MKKLKILFIYTAFNLYLLCLITGCNDNSTVNHGANNNGMAPNRLVENDKVKKATDPIKEAETDYLNAYNEYLRLSKDKGPQDSETLQALMLYQQKHQIYEMLVNASKSN